MSLRTVLLQRLLPAVILLTLLWGCAAFRAEPPEVALAGLQVENLTLSHAILSADLSLFNPNNFDIDVREVRYALSINDIRVAQGTSLESVRLGAHEYGQLPLRLSTAYFNLLRLGPLLEQNKPLPYKITGSVVLGKSLVGSHSFPFDKEGILDLSELTRSSDPSDTNP